MKEHFEVYAIGLVCASVCTNLSIREATKRLNIQHPTGISSQWRKSTDNFSDGSLNPHFCEQNGGYKHYLFNC